MRARSTWRYSTVLVLPVIGTMAVAAFAPSVIAQGHKQEAKATLRAIMQDLGAEYLRLTNALMTGDFMAAETSAKAIHGHPLPDELVSAIKTKLGKRFHSFELLDEQSHRAASSLAKRAAAKDAAGSAKAFGRLGESCVSCHTQFRATLRPLSD